MALRRFTQVKVLWSSLSRPQQVVFVIAGLATFLGLLGLVYWSSQPDFTTLYTQLDPADAGAVVQQLKAAKIPYQLADNGSRILVPSKVVHETRLRLANLGLPSRGMVGFEIFDRQSVGVTDFVQRLNYQRALQGELSRTIAQLKEVSQARVHLVMPQPSLFTEREKPATASVVVSLRPGATLSPEQIRGIVHLVSSSVEGLAPERVTVLDQSGRILSRRFEEGPSALPSPHLEHQRAVESELERRVQSMLDEVVGANRAVVRVAAQLDWTSAERTEERFDPNAVVKSEQRSTESTESTSLEANQAAGTPSNVEQEELEAPSPGHQTRSAKETESLTYEVGRVFERKTLPPGEIKRVSVAVVLDGRPPVVKGEGGQERRESVLRPPEDLEKIKTLVMNAVGYSAARGDEVTVVELPFDTTAFDQGRGSFEQGERRPWMDLLKPVSLVVGLLLLLLLLVRPLLKILGDGRVISYQAVQEKALQEKAEGPWQLKPAAIMGLPSPEAVEGAREAEQQEALKQQLVELTRQTPDRAVHVVRSWIASE